MPAGAVIFIITIVFAYIFANEIVDLKERISKLEVKVEKFEEAKQ